MTKRNNVMIYINLHDVVENRILVCPGQSVVAVCILLSYCLMEIAQGVIITRDSEVIMFSPCVFVCLCVVVYVCHDVCPDDLTMKDWCHTNNSLQAHCWGCLVVQVMDHALMTSLMTSQDYKIGQIFELIYLRQYLSYSVDQKLKMSEMLMAILLVYSTSGKKSLARAQNGGHFWNFEI